ncbi:transcriptional regulator [Streptomyces xiamenensis]|uniref:Transcriptional regulator n=1 Tax=Streptomyces xiamenensis TaxID=408015 RepID=A0A0F7FUY9_9ACTN|nr:TetR family transcriptional regulator [Streptomyces xiamenensis]AKG43644.1 transcriptional regulator [Streptomyces xiamenensis]
MSAEDTRATTDGSAGRADGAPPDGTEGRDGTPRRRRGRPARGEGGGGPGTQERILASARELFAERGYEKTSVRAVARGAEVDQALVHHYFGTKEGLFSAAVALTAAPVTDRIAALDRVAPERAGEEFTRMFFRIWENPVTRAPLLAIVRSALTHETAARIFREFIAGQLLSRLAGTLDAADAQLRAELAAAQLVGTVLLRYALKMPPIATEDAETLIARLAPVVQHHLTGTAPTG